MKHVEKHISRLLVSIAILLVFGNGAFAGEAFTHKGKATTVAEMQIKEQGKPFVFDQISLGEVSQTISQNEHLGFGLFGIYYSGQDVPYARNTTLFNSSYSLKDKRELLFRYLFPFHFFW